MHSENIFVTLAFFHKTVGRWLYRGWLKCRTWRAAWCATIRGPLPSSQNAIAKAHAAVDHKNDHVVVKALRMKLEAATDASSEAREGFRERLPCKICSKYRRWDASDIETARGLCDDSLFCARWGRSCQPLYNELQMGTEHMAPLYSILRSSNQCSGGCWIHDHFCVTSTER
jgi:hypothetical protein